MASTCVLSYWDLSIAALGGSRRIYALLDALGDSTLLIQPTSKHPSYQTVTFPMDLGRRKIGINWGIFNFLWPPTRQIAERAIREHSPELLVMTSIWTLPVAARFPDIPKVLDAHDVNATAIAERFGVNHLFTRLVKTYEAKAVRAVDHLFCCSASDREQFIENYGIPVDAATVVPNGVDTGTFNNVRSEPDEFWIQHLADFVVLFFMGKLDYQPNIAALKFLRESLMPELERRSPGRYKLLVTGGPIPPRQRHPAIVFAGRLPSDRLRQYMSRATICLAPVFTGSGTRLKILEYMAAGKPVLSTAKGAEGIGGHDGRDLYIVEPESFADHVEFLAANPAQASSVGDSAQRFVRERYDWVDCIQPRWRNVFKQYLHAT